MLSVNCSERGIVWHRYCLVLFSRMSQLTSVPVVPQPHADAYDAQPSTAVGLPPADHALLELGHLLQAHRYHFTCITPETHARVQARSAQASARTLRDIFGWSRPFIETRLPASMLELLQRADALRQSAVGFTSCVRYATLQDTLCVHSAWPTLQQDAVFFGPDTYRFVALIERALDSWREEHHALGRSGAIVDLGCGTGAGGIVAVRRLCTDEPPHLVFADINPIALRYARINALLASVSNFTCRYSDVLSHIVDPIALIVANPPYLVDQQARAYRHGGGAMGTELSQRIVHAALSRLVPGGRLILYTATPIVEGRDLLWQALAPYLTRANVRYDYQEIDPDVFGAELDQPAYAQVERIAVIGLTVQVLA